MYCTGVAATTSSLFILLLTLLCFAPSTAATGHNPRQRRQNDSRTPAADPFAVPADAPPSALETSRLLQSSIQALLSSAGSSSGDSIASIPAAQETATRYSNPQPAPRPLAPLACAIFSTITALCASGTAPSPSPAAETSSPVATAPTGSAAFLSLDLPAQASCACYSAGFFVPEPFDAAASACANVHDGGCQGPTCGEAPEALSAMGLCAGQGNVRDAPQAVLGEINAAVGGISSGDGEGTAGMLTGTGSGSESPEETGSMSASVTGGGGGGGGGSLDVGGSEGSGTDGASPTGDSSTAEGEQGGSDTDGEEGAAPRVEGPVLGPLMASFAVIAVFAGFVA